MALAILMVKIIFLLGLAASAIFGALTILILWRFSLSHTAPLALTLVFTAAGLALLAHAFYYFAII